MSNGIDDVCGGAGNETDDDGGGSGSLASPTIPAAATGRRRTLPRHRAVVFSSKIIAEESADVSKNQTNAIGGSSLDQT